MKKTLAISILCFLMMPLGCAAPINPGDEAAAERGVSGKADDTYSYEIKYESYTNSAPTQVGDLISLELTEADASELPASHYEGRYSLRENTADGERASSGFFNVYRYGERSWIRFLDEETGQYETTYEKYSWLYFDGTLVMMGAGADFESFLDPPLSGTFVDCTATAVHDDNVFEESLSVHEYPDVAIENNPSRNEIELRVGSWSMDSDDGDDLAFVVRDGVATATYTNGSGDRIVVTGPANGHGNGEVWSYEDGGESHVATLACTGRTEGQPDPGEAAYVCTGYNASPFEADVTDALRRTPAALQTTVTPSNIGSLGSTELEQLAVVVEQEEQPNLESLLEAVDDNELLIYDVSYGQVAYTWFRFFYGSTEAGFIFAAGTDWLEGQVHDQDIYGCNNAGECSSSLPTPVSDTSRGLTRYPSAELDQTVRTEADAGSLTQRQIRAAMRISYGDDTSDMPFEQVMDFADEGEVNMYAIDYSYDWVQFWAGDTEAGVMFLAGTVIPVAQVGDGDISGCTASID